MKKPVQHFGFKFQCLVDGKDNFLRQNACVSEKIVGQILKKKNTKMSRNYFSYGQREFWQEFAGF